AMSASSSGGLSAAAVAAHDHKIDELKQQIDAANLKMKQAEARSQEMSRALELAKTESAARTAVDVGGFGGAKESDEEAEARVRLAEAKAAKALAAARAAAAGLTVSSADLAAIESGLVVTRPVKKSSPLPFIVLGLVGGLAIMAVVWKLVLDQPTPQQPTAAVVQPVAQP